MDPSPPTHGIRDAGVPAPEAAAPASQAGAPRLDPSYVNAMAHFYRGELGRIMAWRTRLDATTNWAITVTSTVFTVAFSIREVPHGIFFFNIAVVWILLWIEARRYRFYDAFRARVRLLEAHFLVPMVMRDSHFLQGDWEKILSEDLLMPSFKISKFEAVGRRLKRNYVYLFILILGAWLTKIFLHAPVEINSWETFYNAVAAGHGMAPWLVVGVFGITFVGVISMAVYISRVSPGEFTDFGPRKRSLWKL
jgi:uncharacterized membrane protein